MFKKLLITIILISPLFFLIVGYPTNNNQKKLNNPLATSQRCFSVGNVSQFFSCLTHRTRESGIDVLKQTVQQLNDLQPLMGYSFVIFLFGQLMLIPFILRELDHD